MVPARRSGSFPGSGEAGNILSPRSSEASGLGVKMVEYVLATSPTGMTHQQDLDPRIRNLVMVSSPFSFLYFIYLLKNILSVGPSSLFNVQF